MQCIALTPGTEAMEAWGTVEIKFSGPDGVTVDLSETRWAGGFLKDQADDGGRKDG